MREKTSEEITNDKIAGLSPRWKRHPGFSLLFDNPGESLKLSGAHQRLATSRTIPFYQCLYDAVVASSIGEASTFCILPYASLHITAFDGLNVGNVEASTPPACERARDYITRLPDSLGERPPFVRHLSRSMLAARSWKLIFGVKDLVIWSESALAARLRPTYGAYTEFERFKRMYQRLSQSYAERFGVTARTPYEPHVTLGYFANRPAARRARRLFGDELDAIARATEEKRLQLSRVRLYAFTDMGTFVCRR